MTGVFWSSYTYQSPKPPKHFPSNQEFNTKPLSSIPKHPLLVLYTLAPVYPTRRSRHKHSYFRACQGPPSAIPPHDSNGCITRTRTGTTSHHTTPTTTKCRSPPTTRQRINEHLALTPVLLTTPTRPKSPWSSSDKM